MPGDFLGSSQHTAARKEGLGWYPAFGEDSNHVLPLSGALGVDLGVRPFSWGRVNYSILVVVNSRSLVLP